MWLPVCTFIAQANFSFFGGPCNAGARAFWNSGDAKKRLRRPDNNSRHPSCLINKNLFSKNTSRAPVNYRSLYSLSTSIPICSRPFYNSSLFQFSASFLKEDIMSPYSSLQPHARDSLELASLASSSPGPRTSTSSTSSRSGISSSRKLSLEEDDPLDARNPAANGRPGAHGRTLSVSSAFDFSSNLFPLSSTTGNGYAPIGAPISASDGQTALGAGSLEKHKTLTYLNGLSLIVGLIIGSGIFSSPSQVNANAGSPGAALIVWAIAGILAWTGASSYAELGGAIPLNGGAQVYLSKIFGELFGFLFTWCAVMVLKPGSTAIISIIMGEYLVRAAIGAEAENVSAWINKGVALFGLFAVTLLNCISTKLGTRMGDMFMFFKFVALFGITVTGIVVAITGFSTSGEANHDWKTNGWFEGTSTSASAWAVALYAGLWAFDGWDNVRTPPFIQIRLTISRRTTL
jgi:hypothetical protein